MAFKLFTKVTAQSAESHEFSPSINIMGQDTFESAIRAYGTSFVSQPDPSLKERATMADLIMQPWPQPMEPKFKLAAAIADLCNLLQGLAERSDRWLLFDTAFGPAYDRQQAEQLWTQGIWSGCCWRSMVTMSVAGACESEDNWGPVTMGSAPKP